MKVYIVETDPSSYDYYRVGVYSTLEKAKEALAKEEEDEWLGISHIELDEED